MIETRFGLKYPMPHSVVHIVDNSQYNGPLPVVVAEDPSLLASIVVTGAPMGADNKMITLNRSDVIAAAYGMSNLSTDDIKHYGQAVTYAESLVNQGSPVRFMRVTPDDATYAVSSFIVQWRIDDTDDKLHVRFKTKGWPDDFQRDRFKNISRVNEALIKYYKNDNAEEDAQGTWNQRVLINFISAGRGSAYNVMANAINMTIQTKRPANVRYEFATIDTTTNSVVERFFASLINTNNIDKVDAVESVNTTIARRLEGSSIVVPCVNEDAVRELYKTYMSHFADKIATGEVDEYISNAYKAMNINIFDVIFGNYIYPGTDTSVKMPYYQVDMIDTDIPKLSADKKINVLGDSEKTWNESHPKMLYDKILKSTYGVSRDGDTVHVGDLYLSSTENSNPKISIITGINQYTGTVTSVTIPRVYPLQAGEDGNWTTLRKEVSSGKASVPISMLLENIGDVAKYVKNNTISDGAVVATYKKSGNDIIEGFNIFTIEKSVNPGGYVAHEYPLALYYEMLDRTSHVSGIEGTGNAFGFDSECESWNRVGSAVVVKTGSGTDATNNIYVNSYDRVKTDVGNDHRIRVTEAAVGGKIGNVPVNVNLTDDLMGSQFDCIIYNSASIDSWKVKSITIDSKTSKSDTVKFNIGDKFYLAVCANSKNKEAASSDDPEMYDVNDEDNTIDTSKCKTIIEVTSVSEQTGEITGVKIIKNAAYDNKEDDALIKTVLENAVAVSPTYVKGVYITSTPQTAVDPKFGVKPLFTITGFDVVSENHIPEKISRYVVTGAVGSLFRVQNDPTVIPSNYYSDQYGINPTSEVGGFKMSGGYAGFFDDPDISDIEYKWKYSALLTAAFRGQKDPRILSPTRCPAKFLFDAGYNTIVGSTILPYLQYPVSDIINASIIFTDDEKEEILFHPEIIDGLPNNEDIDVKQAMYDLMIQRCYQGIPEDKRPVGPGSGLSLHLDGGVTDANTAKLVNASFTKRFDNPNASWDIGGWVDISTGISYTFTKRIADNLIGHIRRTSINKPFVGSYSAIPADEYTSYFPDLDTKDWELRELYYNTGANTWIMSSDGTLTRRSQRTLLRDAETSDLLQESNMRTLSQLTYLLQNKIDSFLLEYNDDAVIKTLSDECNNIFSNWVGTLVDVLEITFERDKNIDGGDILVCYCNVTFRELVLRVPIIVNVNRRTE